MSRVGRSRGVRRRRWRLAAGVACAFLVVPVVGRPVAAVEPPVNVEVDTVVHNARHEIDWSARIGEPIHAQVQVTGWTGWPVPTGQGSYKIFKNQDCSGTPVNGGSHVLDTHNTQMSWYDFDGYSYTPTSTVTLSVQAYYSGDSRYYSGRGACMPIRVSKALATVRLSVHDEWHHATRQVYVSQMAHAAVEVTSRLALGPTGNVTFRWFTNGTCTGTPKYTRTAMLVGGRIDLASFGFVSGSEAIASFQVRYAGDPRYGAQTSGCAPYAVEKATPHLTTWIHDALHHPVSEVPTAKPVHAAVALTGVIGAPTGTIYVESYSSPGCAGLHGELHQDAHLAIDPAGMAFSHPGPSSIWIRVRYSGDWRYDPAVGACMRLDWLGMATAAPSPTSPPGTPLPGAKPSGTPTGPAAATPAASVPGETSGVSLPSSAAPPATAPPSPAVSSDASIPPAPTAGPSMPTSDDGPDTGILPLVLLLVLAALIGAGGWWRRGRRGTPGAGRA